MDFATMKEELQNRLRSYDLTFDADSDQLGRWINMAQQYICGKRNWPFMLATEIVQTVADITTGTVSINAASTALTFSSAPSVSVENWYIQFSTSNDWYQIADHDQSSTSATITPAYNGTSNLSAGTYKLRKLHYSTSTPLLQILDMKQMVTPIRFLSQSPATTDMFLPLYYDDGVPYHYVMSNPTSTGAIQFSLFPSPSSAVNIMVRGIKTLTDLVEVASGTSNTTTPIPVPWHDVLIHIGAFYGFQANNDTARAATEMQAGEMRIKDMATTLCHDLGRHRVMRSVDSSIAGPLQWSLPSNFGPEIG